MVLEQKLVLQCFIFAVVTGEIMLAGNFFVIMTLDAALISTVVFLFQGWLSWRCAIRIYNRFQYKTIAGFRDDNIDDDMDEILPDPSKDGQIPSLKLLEERLLPDSKNRKSTTSKIFSSITTMFSSTKEDKTDPITPRRNQLISPVSFQSSDAESSTSEYHEFNDDARSEMSSRQQPQSKNPTFSGYLTMKVKRSSLLRAAWTWKRRYVVLLVSGQLIDKTL